MSEFECLYIFLVSPKKDSQVCVKCIYLASSILGNSKIKDGGHLPILYVDPQGISVFQEKVHCLEEGPKGLLPLQPLFPCQPHLYSSPQCSLVLPLPQPFQGGAGLMAGVCISSAFYWVRTHLCRNFLLFKKKILTSLVYCYLSFSLFLMVYISPLVSFLSHLGINEDIAKRSKGEIISQKGLPNK